ncbi:urea transporter [Streptomyces sp. NPDC002078]
MFLESARAGAVFAVALSTADWWYGAYALGGAALGTGAARLLGAPRDRVRAGLEGFNSCLTALRFAVFLGPGRPATVMLAARRRGLPRGHRRHGGRDPVAARLGSADPDRALPPADRRGHLAAPAFRRIRPDGRNVAALPRAASGPTILRWHDVGGAFFRNVSQVFFLEQWYAGPCCWPVSSWRAGSPGGWPAPAARRAS